MYIEYKLVNAGFGLKSLMLVTGSSEMFSFPILKDINQIETLCTVSQIAGPLFLTNG